MIFISFTIIDVRIMNDCSSNMMDTVNVTKIYQFSAEKKILFFINKWEKNGLKTAREKRMFTIQIICEIDL